jgi:uncharacterized RDD family membrane protein YckC
LIDTIHRLETPERVDMPLCLAGFSSRSLAWLIDFGIRGLFYLISMIILGIFVGKGTGAFHFLMLFLLEWIYPVLFELFKQGQTPGKKAMGLKVVRDDGAPVDLMSSLIRNFLRVIDIYPFFYGIGLMTCLIDPKFRRLGDLAAKTLVIHQVKVSSRQKLMSHHSEPLPLRLSVAERSALLSFVERQPQLSRERTIELAELMVDLHGCHGEDAVTKMNAYAAHLCGTSS